MSVASRRVRFSGGFLAAWALSRAGCSYADLAGGLDFTRRMMSCRQLAGETYGEYDALSVLSNPALVGFQPTEWQVAMSGQSLFGGEHSIGAGAVSHAGQPRPGGSFAYAGVITAFSESAFSEIDINGEPTGTQVSPAGQSVGLASAYQWKAWSVGGGVRFARESYGGQEAAPVSRLLLDAGFMSRRPSVRFGAALRGVSLHAISPISMEVGGSLLLGRVTLGGEYVRHQDSFSNAIAKLKSSSYSLGASLSPSRLFDVRAGLFIPMGSFFSGGTGLMIRSGFSVRQGSWFLDYLLSLPIAQGQGVTHLVGLKWEHGRTRRFVTTGPAFALAPKERTLAVVTFDAQNVPSGDAAVVSDILRNELFQEGSFNIVEKSNMDKILEEQAFQQTGCTTQECAVRLGKILNVRFLVVGGFGRVLDEYLVSMRVVDVETARVIYSDSAQGRTLEDVQAGIHDLGNRLSTAVRGIP